MYMLWDKEAKGPELYGLTNAINGRLVPCGAESVHDGLCAEHAAFVADAKAAEVSKIDQKYWYRMPAKRKPKAGPSRVVETILPPDEVGSKLRRAYGNANGSSKTVAWKALDDYQKQRAREIHSREWTAEDQAEKDRADAAAHAKAIAEQAEVAKRRDTKLKPKISAGAVADALADYGRPNYSEVDAMAKATLKRKAADDCETIRNNAKSTETMKKETAEGVEIFGRFLVLKPVVAGSSAVAYFDVETGIKLAITLEGVKRMGPEVVKKIVSRA
jgi:hypothetical protein